MVFIESYLVLKGIVGIILPVPKLKVNTEGLRIKTDNKMETMLTGNIRILKLSKQIYCLKVCWVPVLSNLLLWLRVENRKCVGIIWAHWNKASELYKKQPFCVLWEMWGTHLLPFILILRADVSKCCKQFIANLNARLGFESSSVPCLYWEWI